MKNIFTKSFFLLSALSLLAACNNNSKDTPKKPDDEHEPSLTIDVESVTIQKFESLQLTYTLLYSDDEVRWASSDSSIVTIDQDGLIYGAGVGTAYINATAGDLVSSCTVTVIASTYAPTLVYDSDDIKIATESSFEQDLFVKFKDEFVQADIDLSIKNGSTTGLIEYSYDAEEGRFLHLQLGWLFQL